MDKLLKIPQACGVLNISRSQFYKSELAKLIIKIDRASYVSEQDLQAWIAQHRKLASEANSNAA